MDFIRFLFSWKFLRQVLLALVLTAGIVWGTLIFLSGYTGHDTYIPVPDLRGKLIEEVVKSSFYTDFRFIVLDSVFDADLPPGTILYQDPWVDTRVKQNRQIYVTISSATPDQVSMPDLKFLTLRQAQSMLESYGLKLGNLYYTPAFDADAVQQQLFSGQPIQPGERIYKGSEIDLVVGTGGGSYQILIDETPVDTVPVEGYGVEDYIDI
ncbi:MAG: PASTA domain-containing protein [Bacteroidetes bacterium]|nr:MAG: PASTA domain-containing protein [Bacteroidota bacterium]